MSKSNSTIYEPKGAAKEYSHLAVNLMEGCRFGCRYCYAPSVLFMTRDQFQKDPQPKKDILERLEVDAKRMAGDERSILLCFTSDPYQSDEAGELTRKALLILEANDLTATVLTKGGMRAAQDFDILKRNGWKFGSTISCMSIDAQYPWEVGSPSPTDRIKAILQARSMGIETWVSMEPVWNTEEALDVIGQLHLSVGFWKIGKMNHRKLDIDWVKFREDAIALLESLGAEYYIKKELREC